MPFEVKIRPIDFNASGEPAKNELPVKSATRLRFKRLFERQFMKVTAKDEQQLGGFEPSSLCLDNMVQNFIEDANEKSTCGRKGCKCGNGKCFNSSDDEFDSCSCFGDSNRSPYDACEDLKSLVPCQSVKERNLLADTAKIVDEKKITKRKDDVCMNIVMDGLIALGYDASICKSHWEKSSTCPAGEYEYVDVIIGGERLILDIDFRSEFEIARATKAYKLILQNVPLIFVGKSDRLQRIISMVTEAAKHSLKKKGMPLPPWRKAEYVKAKWLSSYTRTSPGEMTQESSNPIGELPKESLIFQGDAGEVIDLNEEHHKLETNMENTEGKFKNLKVGVNKIGGLTCIIDDNP